ncbi:hypothetical protein HAX54_042078, partial [Datura stramonium]|nr:hypothetical protein [Datura stramonium]
MKVGENGALALATQDFFGIDKDPPLPSDEGLNSKGRPKESLSGVQKKGSKLVQRHRANTMTYLGEESTENQKYFGNNRRIQRVASPITTAGWVARSQGPKNFMRFP